MPEAPRPAAWLPGRRVARRPGRAAWVPVLAALVAGAPSACISGRVLSGYPGYPFSSFTVPGPEETVFPAVMEGLEAEGYAIDFTDRASGFIQTRVGPDPTRPLLLTVVVGAGPDSTGMSEVWVAGFERTPTGDRRVNPLDEVLWKDVAAISSRLSARLGGSVPMGPDERATSER